MLMQVMYYSMSARYHTCAAEVQIGKDREESIAAARRSYVAANAIASADLDAAHPYRTKLAQEFAKYTRNLLGERETALQIAQDAYDDAFKQVVDQDAAQASKDALRELGDYVELIKSRDSV
jgi:hypothetical protein